MLHVMLQELQARLPAVRSSVRTAVHVSSQLVRRMSSVLVNVGIVADTVNTEYQLARTLVT